MNLALCVAGRREQRCILALRQLVGEKGVD